jgi:hypothetical protein
MPMGVPDLNFEPTHKRKRKSCPKNPMMTTET